MDSEVPSSAESYRQAAGPRPTASGAAKTCTPRSRVLRLLSGHARDLTWHARVSHRQCSGVVWVQDGNGNFVTLWAGCLQATMGLYEGETPIYFMIAQGDAEMVKWLYDQNARWRKMSVPTCTLQSEWFLFWSSLESEFLGHFLRPR